MGKRIAAGLLVLAAGTGWCAAAGAVDSAAGNATVGAVVGVAAGVAGSAAAGTKCDNSCLRGLVDAYFVALVAHDPDKVPLAPGVRFVENAAPTRIGAGLWETASEVPGAFKIYVPDPTAQQIGFIGVLKEQGKPIEIGLRLQVESGKITEIEQIVVHTLRENGLKNLDGAPRPAFLATVPPSERVSRDKMLKIGASYYEAIVTSNGKAAPFAADCVRHENGMQTNANPPPAQPGGFGAVGTLGCSDQLNTGAMSYIKRIEPRRVWIADVNTGLVFGMSQFRHPMKEKAVKIVGVKGVDHIDTSFSPFDLPAMHIFKVRGGKIHEIEALGFVAPYESKTGWEAQQGAPWPVCSRRSLQAAVDSYLEAQKSGDRSKMALADKVKYLENMSEVAADKGKWNTALPIALSRSFLDKDRCRTFSEVIVTEGGSQYVIGTRLSVDSGKITGIDSLVSHKGDWLFNANAYLKYSSKEDWAPPKDAPPATMVELINGANNYLDLFSDKAGKIPWGRPCARLEGGAYTNRDGDPNGTCEVGIPPGVLYIVNRDYVVDTEQGVINVFCRFGNSTTGMPDSHTFRLVDGKIRNVHTISVNLTPDRPSPQADDNGVILR